MALYLVRQRKATADPSTPQVEKSRTCSAQDDSVFISQAFTTYLYVDTA